MQSEIARRFKEEKKEYILKSLHYLADNQDKWTCYDELPFPDDWTFKMAHSIVKYLIKHRFSGGCDCGCRADLCITDIKKEIEDAI